MVDNKTKQFVKFNSITKLNQWLRDWTKFVALDSYKIIPIKKELIIVVQFHLTFYATEIALDEEKFVSYEEQLKMIIADANNS